MKSFLYLILLNLSLIKPATATITIENYLHLILDVYNVYKPSSLMFGHFTDSHSKLIHSYNSMKFHTLNNDL